MIVNKRKHATLIEVLIAFGLMTILITALFGFYYEITMTHALVEKTRSEYFRLSYVQSRLASIFTHTFNKKENTEDFAFYTSNDHTEQIEGENLIISYENGVSLDPLFSYHVLGRLYLEPMEDSSEKRLCLLTWPSPKAVFEGDIPAKKEVLLENITEMTFRFFVPPLLTDETNLQREIRPMPNQRGSTEPQRDLWHTSWKKEFQKLPAMVKIILKRNKNNGEEIIFSYFLPDSDYEILYKK